MSTPVDPLERPLRRDAQRNLERIRVAAIKVFREQGLKASHEAIAREADVSIGTVYRRFPDREQLIDVLFEQELDAVLAVADEALAMEDRWQGVVHLFECGMELAACNVGLGQLLTGSPHGAERVERVRERLSPKAREAIERARGAGAIRSDAAAADVPMIPPSLRTLMNAAPKPAPEVCRRYLALMLNGLRPEGPPRLPLPPAIAVETVDRIVTASKASAC